MERADRHTFQVLTKRAERMERTARRLTMRDAAWWQWRHQGATAQGAARWVPPNIWLGVSVESPPYYSRIRHLQRTPAATRFLSCEPLLAPLPALPLEGIDWVIVGGESGPGARRMELDWVREIRDQCRAVRVALFVKQIGSAWAHGRHKGNDMDAWPPDLRIREMPDRGEMQ